MHEEDDMCRAGVDWRADGGKLQRREASWRRREQPETLFEHGLLGAVAYHNSIIPC